MSKLYIGISGKMGSGKTTLTNGLMETLSSFECERISLAKPIKDLQDNIYNELGLTMEGEKDRPLLIALGKWGRSKSASLWLDAAIRKFEESKAEIVICDDVRFENEAEWFAENGLLMRLTGDQRGSNVDETRKDDISETALDEFDFKNIINNEGGVQATLLTALHHLSSHLGLTEQIAADLMKGEGDGKGARKEG